MGKHARIGLLLGASACLLAAMVDWVIDELNEHGNPSAGKLASPPTPVPGRSRPLRGRALAWRSRDKDRDPADRAAEARPRAGAGPRRRVRKVSRLSAPIAVVTAVASALVLGISSIADQRSTKRVESRRALSPRIMVDLVRQPLWLTAVGANIAGFALQVVALSFGSLALVQTILACDLMFAVLILWYQGHRANLKFPKVKHMVAGVAATTVAWRDSSPSGSRREVARRSASASCRRWPSGSSWWREAASPWRPETGTCGRSRWRWPAGTCSLIQPLHHALGTHPRARRSRTTGRTGVGFTGDIGHWLSFGRS